MKAGEVYFLHTGIKQSVIDEIIRLAEKYGLKKVILFGSRSRGDFKEKSDIEEIVEKYNEYKNSVKTYFIN
mgnify:CR=1 FL=1